MSRALRAALAMGAYIQAGCVSQMAAQDPHDISRQAFLQTVDRALARRDATGLVAIADVEQWRATGRPELESLTLWLPPPPLARKRDLSANEVLYEDGDGKTWRVRLRRDGERRAWLVTILPQPCPSRNLPRRGLADEAPDRPAADVSTAAPKIWTPLECWPLPQ